MKMSIKFIRFNSSSNTQPWRIDGATVENDTVIMNGAAYPVKDIKVVRQGIKFNISVAYQDGQSEEPPKQAVPDTETVKTIRDTSEPKTAVPTRPRFRMHKVEATPENVNRVVPVEPPVVPEPVAPTPAPEPVALSDGETIEELARKIKDMLTPEKPDYEGTVELPDGGRIELRYFKGAD